MTRLARALLVAAVHLLPGQCRWRYEDEFDASLRCWLDRHRDRRFHPNPDNHEVIALQCRRCGRVRDPKQYLSRKQPLDDVAWGGVLITGR